MIDGSPIGPVGPTTTGGLPERTYTQAEADALIAGAYIALKNIIRVEMETAEQFKPDHKQGALAVLREAMQQVDSLVPDAARLALAKLIADTRDSALDEAAEALSRVQHVAGNVKLILGLKGNL